MLRGMDWHSGLNGALLWCLADSSGPHLDPRPGRLPDGTEVVRRMASRSSLSDLPLQAQRMLTQGIVDRWIAEHHG